MAERFQASPTARVVGPDDDCGSARGRPRVILRDDAGIVPAYEDIRVSARQTSRMPAAVRARLPALDRGGARARVLGRAGACAVPADTPYRALAALLLAAIAVALASDGARRWPACWSCSARVALLPALSRVYYDELLLPFASPFVAAYWLGALRAAAGSSIAGVAARRAARAGRDDPVRRRRRVTGGLFTLAVIARRAGAGRPPAARPRRAAPRAAREGGAARAPARGRRRPRGRRRAHADRGRAARRRRARAERDDRAGHRRAPAGADAPGARARGVRGDRDAPGARRSTSCAACSACCAARTPS